MRETLAQQIQRATTVVHRCVKDFHNPVQQLRLLLDNGTTAGLDDLLQLIGPQFSENTLFRAGYALEQALGFDVVPGRYR